MAKEQNKTRPTKASVAAFIDNIPNPVRRADAKVLVKLMREVTGEKPVMWGPSIIGFGKYHYTYASGHEGDSGWTGFSPRATAITIYIVQGFKPYKELMEKLGKYKTSVSCLYVKKLSDIDLPTLKKIIEISVRDVRKKYKV